VITTGARAATAPRNSRAWLAGVSVVCSATSSRAGLCVVILLQQFRAGSPAALRSCRAKLPRVSRRDLAICLSRTVRHERSEYGKFAWSKDAEGTRFELRADLEIGGESESGASCRTPGR
jgi:hypothetical protein